MDHCCVMIAYHSSSFDINGNESRDEIGHFLASCEMQLVSGTTQASLSCALPLAAFPLSGNQVAIEAHTHLLCHSHALLRLVHKVIHS